MRLPRPLTFAVVLLSLTLIAAPLPSFGQCEEARLVGDDSTAQDEIGASVSVDGDFALAGAPGHQGSGAAYVFRREGVAWIQDAKLVPADAMAGNGAGSAVAILGDLAILGSPFADGSGVDSGSAAIFRRVAGDWVQEALLTASDASGGDRLGGSVAITPDLAIVGAQGDDDETGAAYVFRREGTNWVEEAKLTAIDAEPGNRFGIAVSLVTDRALVGADGDDDGAAQRGRGTCSSGMERCGVRKRS